MRKNLPGKQKTWPWALSKDTLTDIQRQRCGQCSVEED